MKDKDTSMGNPNPTIQSTLQHLAEEAILPEKVDLWPAVRVTLAASKALVQSKELSVKKRFVFAALAAVLVLAVVFVFAAKTVTTVSAKEVLDRAYQAQSQQVPTQGIGHIRNEVYSNIEALPEDQGMDTIIDSYSDLQTGYFRLVTTNAKNGRVLDASAYDGTNTYSQDYDIKGTGNEPLTIYRTPQGQVDVKPVGGAGGLDQKALFEQMRNDPHVLFDGKDTWEDGRSVYILRSQQPVKAIVDGKPESPNGSITMYFDAKTYEQLGYRMTMEKDGQDILLASQKVLVNEILPAGTNIAWDLSDVQGITIVDDPERTHGDLLPEVVTPQEASQNASARHQTLYLLKEIPAGYSLEITAPPQQSADGPYIYVASYRTPENDYFVMQAAAPADVQAMQAAADETYTTASGLIITFIKDTVSSSSGKTYVDSIVEAPDGTVFMLGSTLPRETVKAWAEELIPIRK